MQEYKRQYQFMQDRGANKSKQPQKHATTDKEDTNKGVCRSLNGLEKLVESGQEKMQAFF